MYEVGLRLNGEEVLTARVFDKDQAEMGAAHAVDVFIAHVLSDAEDQDEAIKWLKSLKYGYTIREISEPSEEIPCDLDLVKRLSVVGKENKQHDKD